jgi:transposase
MPGLSHTQLQQLRDMAQREGHGKTGRSRSVLDNALALRHVAEHQAAGQSFDAAVKAVARADLVSPYILRRAADEFQTSGTLTSPSSVHLGRGNPDHPLHSPSEPSIEIEICIHRAVSTAAQSVSHIAVKHIQQQLMEEEGVFVSDWTLRRWLHELGYTWDEKRFIGSLTPQSRGARIRSFIWHYAKALRLQRDGTHIVIYLDESYIHSSHQMKQGWHPIAGPHKNNETQGEADKGKRLIIIHAMSQDGMLDVEDAVGSNFLHEQTPTAQFVFEAASFDDSDYHNSIDGEAFTLWVKNRLLPTFHHLYPDKKMIIVMDNASYHKPRGFDWITPYKMNKVQCASFFDAQGVRSITVQRDGTDITFHHRTFNLHARNKTAPALKELQQAVRSHLDVNPHINQTEVDKLLHPLGYSIVWTPPFVPEVQPIELIWAHVKGVVASRYTLNRTIDQTRQQTDDAFDTISATMIQKRIAHCHAWIDTFMRTDEAGSLRQYGSLMKLVDADPVTRPPPDLSAPLLGNFHDGGMEEEQGNEQ